ncbi:hypothetical protein AOE01nite_03220 [Acetobacter oeni]|uniref:Uncharacterized protein n=1 Tax=Acetobacter oeni TaxID=304077 RepID=A0A511XGN8_9PROT|nr:hypothetical protein AA21952_0561 [Acetobacter oeni LMG 21952]GEN62098.1 hypothetical protein AOE01nite_03220 [Acetobacter oeni]
MPGFADLDAHIDESGAQYRATAVYDGSAFRRSLGSRVIDPGDQPVTDKEPAGLIECARRIDQSDIFKDEGG